MTQVNVQLLRDQMKWAHDTMEATMADVTHDIAHFTKTKKALPVGAAYAHAVIGEDVVISMMLAGKKPIAKNAKDIGVSALMPSMSEWDKHEKWAQTVKVDLPKFKKYAQKVYKATDKWLASLTDKNLAKELDLSSMGMGKQTIVYVFTNFILLHMANLTGEVSAAKGFQGKKGYPF